MTRNAAALPAVPIFAALLLAHFGCSAGEEGEPAPRGAAGAPSEAQKASTQRARKRPYGKDGELLESDQVIAGLVLPRGLEPFRQEDRRHVFRTDVPLDKLQRYFGPRLLTGQVDRVGHGAIFRRATVRHARGGSVKLDVKLFPGAAANRVEIVEIRPAPLHAPTVEEIRRREDPRVLD